MWNRLNDEGRLVAQSTGENTDGTINFVPRMGKDKLVEGYKRLISTIYSPKHYFRRINTLIRNYKPTVKVRPSKYMIKATLMSIWHVGILSKSRFLYWKLILKTIFTKSKAIGVAVEHAIFWHHFEKVAKKITTVDPV
ncbi:DUF4070 domain-containing protein [Nanoarchaeota archaeon]